MTRKGNAPATSRSWDPTLFQGTASYYSRYRPTLPSSFVARFADRLRIDDSSRVLDVGCGTSHLTAPLRRLAERVVGVDPDEGMLTEARHVAAGLGLGSIGWVRALGEALPFAPDTFDVVTIASALHWKDRERALEQVWAVLRPQGSVAVISSGTPLRLVMERRGVGAAVAEVQDRWFGSQRRAGSGVCHRLPEEPQEVIIAPWFGPFQRFTVPWRQDWDVDRMIGLLYSTSSSFRVRGLLGERIGEFESEIREAIMQAEPNGRWTSDEEILVLIGTKGDERSDGRE